MESVLRASLVKGTPRVDLSDLITCYSGYSRLYGSIFPSFWNCNRTKYNLNRNHLVEEFVTYFVNCRGYLWM
jgi:hypothetical protein